MSTSAYARSASRPWFVKSAALSSSPIIDLTGYRHNETTDARTCDLMDPPLQQGLREGIIDHPLLSLNLCGERCLSGQSELFLKRADIRSEERRVGNESKSSGSQEQS